MRIKVLKNSEELGKEAAAYCADILRKAIAEKGSARIILSTGASQFDILKAMVKQDIDWSKVEMFHLDEYINMPKTHPASFRKYLEERFVNLVNLKKAYFVCGEGNFEENIRMLTEEVRKAPIDLALIGIGENAHIAFNDPPADFHTKEAYIVVNLDEKCRNQQFGEGWFPTIEDVPKQAISMTVYQMMQSSKIVSFVPYKVKADAVRDTLENELTNLIPATMLKTHDNWMLFLDEDSAYLADKSILNKYA
jgi:glucosamine-6-phosphate deaminase